MAPALLSSLFFFFPDSDFPLLREWETLGEGERFLPDTQVPSTHCFHPHVPASLLWVGAVGKHSILGAFSAECYRICSGALLLELSVCFCITSGPCLCPSVPPTGLCPASPALWGGVDAQHGVHPAPPAPPNAGGTRNGDGKNTEWWSHSLEL